MSKKIKIICYTILSAIASISLTATIIFAVNYNKYININNKQIYSAKDAFLISIIIFGLAILFIIGLIVSKYIKIKPRVKKEKPIKEQKEKVAKVKVEKPIKVEKEKVTKVKVEKPIKVKKEKIIKVRTPLTTLQKIKIEIIIKSVVLILSILTLVGSVIYYLTLPEIALLVIWMHPLTVINLILTIPLAIITTISITSLKKILIEKEYFDNKKDAE